MSCCLLILRSMLTRFAFTSAEKATNCLLTHTHADTAQCGVVGSGHWHRHRRSRTYCSCWQALFSHISQIAHTTC